MTKGIIGTDGKPLQTEEARIEALEKRIKTLEDALSLHGSFLMHLKKFMDILPTNHYKKEEKK